VTDYKAPLLSQNVPGISEGKHKFQESNKENIPSSYQYTRTIGKYIKYFLKIFVWSRFKPIDL
jgi:hypothetical protein